MDLYTEVEWQRLCAEVAKLRLERRKIAKVIPLPAGGPGGLLTGVLQSKEKARSDVTAREWTSGGADRLG